MKQRIFSRGKGWYIPCTNYNDQNDKCYVNVGFKKGEKPDYQAAGDNPFVFIDIDIIEWKLNCYKGKPEMFVFKYEYIQPNGEMREVEKEDGKMFGAANLINPDDLPFY